MGGVDEMIAAKEQKRMLFGQLDIDWLITSSETHTLRVMWNDGAGLDTIAAELGRSQFEVTLLVIEQAELGLIEQRRHGVYGQ